ncbi:MAG: hypothetical protein SGJ09_05395 [Phycisphaerae bacterium]|nr:hypothetical protein [Phycisphaerae bacterium]
MRPNLAALVVIGIFILFGVLASIRAGELPGKRYERIVDKSFVLVDVPPPIGGNADEKAERAWLPVDSSQLLRPGVVRIEGVAPISWKEPETRSPFAARAEIAAGAKNVGISWRDTIGVWIAALCTFAIFSFLWGDNPLYKLAESLLVGVSAAYWMVVGFWSTIVQNLLGKLMPGVMREWALPALPEDASPQWLTLVPLVLSVLLLMRLLPKGGWLSTWALAFIFGTTAAIKFVAFVQADLLGQISNSIVPLYATDASGAFDLSASLGNITMLVGILCVLAYFFFSFEHKGGFGKVARVGVWYLMIFFGSAFGFTVMGRIALLSERFEFLFDDWLWLMDPAKAHTFIDTVNAPLSMLLSVGLG